MKAGSKAARVSQGPRGPRRSVAARLLDEDESEANASLLDLIDNTLNRGVAIEGEVVLGLADVDLVYLRLSALLGAADRIRAPRRRGSGGTRLQPRPGRRA